MINIISPHSFFTNSDKQIQNAYPYKLQRFIFFRFLKKIGFHSLLINKRKIRKMKGTIIVFDVITPQFLKWLGKNKKDCRLIFWYWNPVAFSINPKLIPEIFEIWSYSKADCKKYGFRWNSTFATQTLMDYSNSHFDEMIKYDVTFIGRNKGRINKIKEFSEAIKKLGYKTNIIITKNKFFDPKNHGLCKLLSYKEYLKIENQSRALIDFGISRDVGLTLRSIESLYLNKKLIVDYDEFEESSLVKSNAFIVRDLNQFNAEEFKKFMAKPIENPDKNVIEYYSFHSWINRF